MVREFGGSLPEDISPEAAHDRPPVFDVIHAAESLSPTKAFVFSADYGALSGVQHDVKPAVFIADLKDLPTQQLSERFLLHAGLVIDRE